MGGAGDTTRATIGGKSKLNDSHTASQDGKNVGEVGGDDGITRATVGGEL